ncbi:hypothetical protein PR048_022256 [Dryococelus australis]|uniref:Integrase catalytic domain-containing protein n=1 Tax=Dryococelus australis TaxID=614101 RepID=A0ABQ9H0G5_9NEOP|nr:hypothetical protein PR048_022256 [Dryococelus australis]
MAMASEDSAHVEKLKGHSNFSIWKFQIVVLLKAVDLYNVVSTEFREGEQDTDWGKNNAKAQRYIVTIIDKGNIQFIMSCDSAKGMFDKMYSIYERDSSHNKSSLLQNFFNYKIDKVASGLSDLQNLCMKLKSVGHTVDDETMMGKILSYLPDRFRYFLTAWELTPKSDRALTNVTARLLAEEERGHTSSTHDHGPYCPELHEKKQLGCKICRKDNHTGQSCYFRDRNNKSTTSNRDKVAFLTRSTGGNPEGSWVLDSGCTSHMINNSDSLTNVTGIEPEIITSKKNENMCADLKGDIEYQECVLKNVLYVQDLTRNLISGHNTTENVANDLTDWCRERGIKIDYAPAATPQLNGRAERLSRMLMEKTRALLFDSGLEKKLWGEALCTATYLLNRSLSDTVDTTSAELLYGKRPDLSNLKLFGSLAYAKKLKKLGKLDKRCDKLIMVGHTINGYRLWNSENREIKLSRYITFVELTEVSATNNSSQEIIADTVSLVNSEETSLRLADNMEVRRTTTVLQDYVVDEPFHDFLSDQDTAKTSEMLDSLPEKATEIENSNHQGRKE